MPVDCLYDPAGSLAIFIFQVPCYVPPDCFRLDGPILLGHGFGLPSLLRATGEKSACFRSMVAAQLVLARTRTCLSRAKQRTLSCHWRARPEERGQ